MKKSLGAKTIVHPTPVFVIGTYDKEGNPNVMTASWAGICCSQPPCVAVALRKATYTYGNIVEKKAFTISIPGESHIKEADYFGMASGKSADKFAVTGLTPIKGGKVNAPYVDEFPLILECKLLHTIEIGLHTQFIGEVVDVKADESVLDKDGTTNIEKIKPFMFTPDKRKYYGVGKFLGDGFSIGKDFMK